MPRPLPIPYPKNVVEVTGVHCLDQKLEYLLYGTWTDLNYSPTQQLSYSESQSKIRVSVYSAVAMKDVAITPKSFPLQDNPNTPVNLNAADFQTGSSYGTLMQPMPIGPLIIGYHILYPVEPTFISVLEPADIAASYPPPFNYVAGGQSSTCTNGLTIIRRGLPNGHEVYAFSWVPRSSPSAIAIPAIAGKNYAFTTNAQFGVVEINESNEKIVSAELFYVDSASYNGAPFAYKGMMFGLAPSTTPVQQIIVSDNGLPNELTLQNGTQPLTLTDARFQNQSATKVRQFELFGRHK